MHFTFILGFLEEFNSVLKGLSRRKIIEIVGSPASPVILLYDLVLKIKMKIEVP
jgi:hypothetical protein